MRNRWYQDESSYTYFRHQANKSVRQNDRISTFYGSLRALKGAKRSPTAALGLLHGEELFAPVLAVLAQAMTKSR